MPTSINAKPFVPDVVNVKLGFPKPDWLSPLLLMDRWSPFTAACIFCGVRPGTIDDVTKTADAVREIDPIKPRDSLDYTISNHSLGNEIRELTEIIATNAFHQGREYVIPSEIVAWAKEKYIISPKSEVARTFETCRQATLTLSADDMPISVTSFPTPYEKIVQELDQAKLEISRLTLECDEFKKLAKKTGKHHALKRVAILAASLHRLANNREACVDSNENVVAAKIAREVHDMRVYYGFGDDDEDPTHDLIKQHVTEALSKKKWEKSKTKN